MLKRLHLAALFAVLALPLFGQAPNPTLGEGLGITTYPVYGQGGLMDTVEVPYLHDRAGDLDNLLDFPLWRAFTENEDFFDVADSTFASQPNWAGRQIDRWLLRTKHHGIEVMWSMMGKLANQNATGTDLKIMPLADGDDPTDPASWALYAEAVKQAVIRYGPDTDVYVSEDSLPGYVRGESPCASSQRFLIDTATGLPYQTSPCADGEVWVHPAIRLRKNANDFFNNFDTAGLDIPIYFQIGNEFNFLWHGGTIITPRQYGVCFSVVYDSIRAYSDSARIVMGSSIGFSPAQIGEVLDVMDSFYAAKGQPTPSDFWLSPHWYMRQNSTQQGFNDDLGASPEFVDAYGFAGEPLDSICASRGLKGWFVSETGWNDDPFFEASAKQRAPLQEGFTLSESMGLLIFRLGLIWGSLDYHQGITVWHTADNYDGFPYALAGLQYKIGGRLEYGDLTAVGADYVVDAGQVFNLIGETDILESQDDFTRTRVLAVRGDTLDVEDASSFVPGEAYWVRRLHPSADIYTPEFTPKPGKILLDSLRTVWKDHRPANYRIIDSVHYVDMILASDTVTLGWTDSIEAQGFTPMPQLVTADPAPASQLSLQNTKPIRRAPRIRLLNPAGASARISLAGTSDSINPDLFGVNIQGFFDGPRRIDGFTVAQYASLTDSIPLHGSRWGGTATWGAHLDFTNTVPGYGYAENLPPGGDAVQGASALTQDGNTPMNNGWYWWMLQNDSIPRLGSGGVVFSPHPFQDSADVGAWIDSIQPLYLEPQNEPYAPKARRRPYPSAGGGITFARWLNWVVDTIQPLATARGIANVCADLPPPDWFILDPGDWSANTSARNEWADSLRLAASGSLTGLPTFDPLCNAAHPYRTGIDPCYNVDPALGLSYNCNCLDRAFIDSAYYDQLLVIVQANADIYGGGNDTARLILTEHNRESSSEGLTGTWYDGAHIIEAYTAFMRVNAEYGGIIELANLQIFSAPPSSQGRIWAGLFDQGTRPGEVQGLAGYEAMKAFRGVDSGAVYRPLTSYTFPGLGDSLRVAVFDVGSRRVVTFVNYANRPVKLNATGRRAVAWERYPMGGLSNRFLLERNGQCLDQQPRRRPLRRVGRSTTVPARSYGWIENATIH